MEAGGLVRSSRLRGALLDREWGVKEARGVEDVCGARVGVDGARVGVCGVCGGCVVFSSPPLPSSSCKGEDMSILTSVM